MTNQARSRPACASCRRAGVGARPPARPARRRRRTAARAPQPTTGRGRPCAAAAASSGSSATGSAAWRAGAARRSGRAGARAHGRMPETATRPMHRSMNTRQCRVICAGVMRPQRGESSAASRSNACAQLREGRRIRSRIGQVSHTPAMKQAAPDFSYREVAPIFPAASRLATTRSHRADRCGRSCRFGQARRRSRRICRGRDRWRPREFLLPLRDLVFGLEQRFGERRSRAGRVGGNGMDS